MKESESCHSLFDVKKYKIRRDLSSLELELIKMWEDCPFPPSDERPVGKISNDVSLPYEKTYFRRESFANSVDKNNRNK